MPVTCPCIPPRRGCQAAYQTSQAYEISPPYLSRKPAFNKDGDREIAHQLAGTDSNRMLACKILETTSFRKEHARTMESTRLYQPVHPQYQQRDDPAWREALARALRRSERDRERERQQTWQRT